MTVAVRHITGRGASNRQRPTTWPGHVARRVILAVAGLVAAYLAFRRWPLPYGVAIRGVVLGMLVALLATGQALIYRANRVINFAQADLGSMPMALAVSLVVFWHWPYPIGLLSGLAVAVVLGVVVEFFLIRRFRNAPRLILTVATLGVTTLLVLLAILIPRAWGRNVASERLPQVFRWHWDIGVFRLQSNDIVALIVAPLAMGAVAVFLGRTSLGTAVRAAAERSERASMLGIPVGRVSSVVWALASALSFLALFMRAGILGAPIGPAFAFSNLLYSLAALVIGRLDHLARVAIAGIVVGFVDYWVQWHSPDAGLVVPIVSAAIVVSLLVQRGSVARVATDVGSSWRGADEVRPLSAAARRLPEVRAIRWLGMAAVGAALVLVPLTLPVNRLIQVTEILTFAMVGLSLMVLTGWAGQISLGQIGLVAVGAAVSATFTSRWHVDLTLSLVLGGLAAGAAALCIGLPALRLRGLYLAVTTLAFGMTVTEWLLSDKFFGWMPKRRFKIPKLFGQLNVDTPTRFYVYTVVILAVAIVAVRGIRSSRTGRIIVAQRENLRAAQSFAVPKVEGTLRAFVLSGIIAGVAGGLTAHMNHTFSLNSYPPAASLSALTSAIIGGLGSVTGVVAGAVYTGVTRRLPDDWRLLASGIGVLGVLLLLPSGLGGQIFRLRDFVARWATNRRATPQDANTVEASGS